MPPPLLLLTPIGLDSHCWDELQVPGREMIAHEFPGFGSRPPSASPFDLTDLADEIHRCYTGQLDVVGVSMGGMVAQHLALRHPSSVRSLLLAATSATVDPAVIKQRADRAEAGGMASVLDDTLGRWFLEATLARRPEPDGVRYVKRALLALDPHRYADAWRAIAGHDVSDRLAEIAVATSCVAGAQDRASPVESLKAMVSKLPRSRLVVIEGAHLLPLECPEEFSRAVQEHLEWVEGD